MPDELELIRAAVAGDRQAFDDLISLKRERVVRTAFQITGDLEDALDVGQAVFLKLWQGLGRFDPRRRFDTWLYRVTVNAAIDMLRSKAPRGVLQPLPRDLEQIDSGEVSRAEADLDLGRLQQAFLRIAGRLAPKQRAAFVLREIEGLPTAEVARVMGVTESTVRNHLMQARRILRAGLERDYPGLLPGGGRSDARNGEGGQE
jgi:RNA polymerase sigma-70 factor (ECF subfamily)